MQYQKQAYTFCIFYLVFFIIYKILFVNYNRQIAQSCSLEPEVPKEISTWNLNSQGEFSPDIWEFYWVTVFCLVHYMMSIFHDLASCLNVWACCAEHAHNPTSGSLLMFSCDKLNVSFYAQAFRYEKNKGGPQLIRHSNYFLINQLLTVLLAESWIANQS